MFELIISFIEILGKGSNKKYETVEVTPEDLSTNLNKSIKAINVSDKAEIVIPAKFIDEQYDECYSMLEELKAFSKTDSALVEFKGNISERTFEESGDVALSLYRVPKFGITLDALKSALSSTSTQ
jgi:hypothetical protein